MHVCSAKKTQTNKKKEKQIKNSGTGTFSNRNKDKQPGDAREKFPSTTHFSEKQWQFSVVYFVQTFCICPLCQVVTLQKFEKNHYLLVIYLNTIFKGATYSISASANLSKWILTCWYNHCKQKDHHREAQPHLVTLHCIWRCVPQGQDLFVAYGAGRLCFLKCQWCSEWKAEHIYPFQ